MPAKFRRLIRVPKKKTDKDENSRFNTLNGMFCPRFLMKNTVFFDKRFKKCYIC